MKTKMMPLQKANRLQQVQEYYFSKKLKEVKALQKAGRPIINLGIGSPDLQPPKAVVSSLQQSVTAPFAHAYQDYRGIPELRKAMAGFYQNKYKVSMNEATEILPLMGSKEGIMHLSMAFLNPGDEVLVPNPGYPTYISATKLAGGIPIGYDLFERNQWHPDFDALEKQDVSRVKLMWVNYPHMPTGANLQKRMFEPLIAFAKKHGILVINDNPYSFILNDNPMSILSVHGAKEVALELNSLSKTFNIPGWRVGMLLGAKHYIDAVVQVKSNMDSGMFYGIQCGAVEALQMEGSWVKDMNTIYKKRRVLVWQIAKALKCTFSENTAGLFVWAKTPHGTNAEKMADSLLYSKDVFVTPGTVFGSNGKDYLRFSLCVNEEKLKEVISRI